MQAAELVSLGELVQCSICLETYTKPKMLPCQHTYCNSCLLRLTVNRTNIRCPQCRELHDLPPTGVKGFKENLVINNLLSLTSPREEAECSDCQLPLPVSNCDHCDQNICVECRVKHATLSFEIDMNLKSLQESITTEEYGKKISAEKQYFERCLYKLQKEHGRMKKVFEKEIQRVVKLLNTRRQYFEQYFAVIAGLYKSVINARAGVVDPPYFVEDFSKKLRHCKTVESLQDLKNDLTDLTNVARLVEKREDEFKFVNDSLTLEIETFGRVEFGEAVVGIRGKYVAPIEQSIERSNESNVANVPIDITNTKSSSDSRNCNTSSASTSTMSEGRQDSQQRVAPPPTFRDIRSLEYRQNKLPRNVGYASKCAREAPVVIGQDNLEPGFRLSEPLNCAYHLARDELYVVDTGSNRIMIYDTKGRNGRVFRDVEEPHDVAVSDDGEYIFMLQCGRWSNSSYTYVVHKLTLNGQLLTRMLSFPLGELRDCRSVVCHDKHVAVLSNYHKCVVIFTETGDYVRHIILESIMSGVGCMAVDNDGNLYVTETHTGSVNVYSWQGQFQEAFGGLKTNGYSPGLAVDGDGCVCVSRFYGHRIDVYDYRHRLFMSVGRDAAGLSGPSGLCLLPDGRLVVADTNNSCLRMF